MRFIEILLVILYGAIFQAEERKETAMTRLYQVALAFVKLVQRLMVQWYSDDADLASV